MTNQFFRLTLAGAWAHHIDQSDNWGRAAATHDAQECPAQYNAVSV